MYCLVQYKIWNDDEKACKKGTKTIKDMARAHMAWEGLLLLNLIMFPHVLEILH